MAVIENTSYAQTAKMYHARRRALDLALEAKRGLDYARRVVTGLVFIGLLLRNWRDPMTGSRVTLCLIVTGGCWVALAIGQALWAKRVTRLIEAEYPLPPLPKLNLGDDDE